MTPDDERFLRRAIALAQGTNRTAALDRTKLIRITVAGREEIPQEEIGRRVVRIPSPRA